MKKLHRFTALAGAIILAGCSSLPQALQPRQDTSYVREDVQEVKEPVTVVQDPVVEEVQKVELFNVNCPAFAVEDRAEITVVGDKYYKDDSSNAVSFNALVALNIDEYSYGDRFASFKMALLAITENPKNKALLDDSFVKWVLSSNPTEVEAKIFVQEMFASPAMAVYLGKTKSTKYKDCDYSNAKMLLDRFKPLSRSEFKYLYSSLKYVDMKDKTNSDKTYKANLI